MALLSTAATGIYAATMSVVALANPLLFGFFNLLTPKSVNALHEGGKAMLHRQALRDALLLAGIMSGFCVVLALFGGEIFALLFPREDYRAGEDLLVILGLSSLAASVGVPASTGLAAAERVRAIAAVMVGTAVVGVALVALSLNYWGLMGGAYALLVTEIIGSAGRWVAFLALPPVRTQQEQGNVEAGAAR
jgi:O-antigen/teichoic acid export membrane protein